MPRKKSTTKKASSSKGIIFISGQMRSGTTLLADMLDRQSEIRVIADHVRIGGAMRVAFGGFLDPYVPLDDARRLKFFAAYLNTVSVGPHGKARIAQLADHISSKASKRGERFRPNDITTLPEFDTIASFYLQRIAAERNRDYMYIGNKETRSESLVAKLARGYIKGLLIIRDPRDSVLSYMKKNEGGQRFGGGNDVETLISLWKRGFEVWHKLAGPNLLALRYEDLVVDAASEMKKIGVFLDTELIVPSVGINNSSFNDIKKGMISSDAIARWREQEDHWAVRQVAEGLQEEMKIAGYELS